MDKIFLHGLEIECVVGVWEWERQITQKVIVDLDMGWDVSVPGESDELDDTLNYKAVAQRVKVVVQEGQFKLIESMAEQVAATVLNEFGVPWIRVRVNKRGAVSTARDVGVIIEREKP